MKASSDLLEKVSKLDSAYIEDLVKYYSTQNFDKTLSWQDLLKKYQMRSSNEFKQSEAEIASIDTNTNANSHDFDSGFGSIDSSNKATKTKKVKPKGKTQISDNGKTIKLIDQEKPEIIREKTEPLGILFSSVYLKIFRPNYCLFEKI